MCFQNLISKIIPPKRMANFTSRWLCNANSRLVRSEISHARGALDSGRPFIRGVVKRNGRPRRLRRGNRFGNSASKRCGAKEKWQRGLFLCMVLFARFFACMWGCFPSGAGPIAGTETGERKVCRRDQAAKTPTITLLAIVRISFDLVD